MSAAPHLEPSIAVNSLSETESTVTEYATKGVKRNLRSNLRLVAPLQVQKASRGVFGMVLLGILAFGLIGMLLINTTLAQGSFTLGELRSQQAELARAEASLTEEVAALAAPSALESQARALGMVPSSTPAFIQIPNGKVLGKPKAAPGVAIATSADATVGEGAESPAAAGVPIAPGVGYDPAAADAKANEEAQAAKAGKKKKNAVGIWSEPTVIEAEVIANDAFVDAVPVR
jgi:hypothetical protein